MLRQKTEELGSSENKNRSIQQENEQLRIRLQELSDINRKVAEYENRIALLTQ